MPIVIVIFGWTTNGIPGAIQEQGYVNVIVGVGGFLLASGCAPTSTISWRCRDSCGSAVAELSLAAGFAPTPFPLLMP